MLSGWLGLLPRIPVAQQAIVADGIVVRSRLALLHRVPW